MAKIIKVEEEIVLIGNPDGSVMEGRRADCNFDPNIGDEVEVFSTGDRLIVNNPYPNSTLQSKFFLTLLIVNNLVFIS